MWWLGLVLMLGGEVGNFFAYGWAPATVVSPLGAVAVVSNCLLSRIVLKEEITKRNLIGVFFAIAGATTIAFTAPTSILMIDADTNTTDVALEGEGGNARYPKPLITPPYLPKTSLTPQLCINPPYLPKSSLNPPQTFHAPSITPQQSRL